MYCKAPHNSLVIQPSGHINICCGSQRSWNVGHISDIEDLYELWNTAPDIIKLRNDDEQLIEDLCGYCLKNARNGMSNTWTFYNVPGHGARSYAKADGKIRYLEFTTSNLCNQTCATCSSYYSSKWLPLEKEATEMSLDLESWKKPGDVGFNDFDVPTYRMSDTDVEKIIPLLPDLEVLVVKGGEPFADNKNYHILKSLLEVNDKCVIEMTTNLSKLPQRYLDLFADKPNSFQLSISMDGVGKTYDWVRSTPFEQTLENIERWNAVMRQGNRRYHNQININHRINIFNLFNVEDTLNFWNDNFEKYKITSFTQMGWVKRPDYSAVPSMMPQEWIKEFADSIKIPENLHPEIYLNNMAFFEPAEEVGALDFLTWRQRMFMFACFMNYKRGINILELHPELKQLK